MKNLTIFQLITDIELRELREFAVEIFRTIKMDASTQSSESKTSILDLNDDCL